MSIADAKAALDGGSVDAALIAGAAAYQAKQQGYYMVADGEGLIKAIIAVAVREVRLKEKIKKNRNLTRAPVNCRPKGSYGIKGIRP